MGVFFACENAVLHVCLELGNGKVLRVHELRMGMLLFLISGAAVYDLVGRFTSCHSVSCQELKCANWVNTLDRASRYRAALCNRIVLNKFYRLSVLQGAMR